MMGSYSKKTAQDKLWDSLDELGTPTSAIRDLLLRSVSPHTGASKKKYCDFGDHCLHWYSSFSHHYAINLVVIGISGNFS